MVFLKSYITKPSKFNKLILVETPDPAEYPPILPLAEIIL